MGNSTAVNEKAGPCIRCGCPADKKTSSEERLQSSGQRAQAPQSACAQVIAAAWLETAATGRVRRRTKTERSLSYPNQETTLGMRRVGEPLHCSATLARLGQKHQFVHLCQQLERLQAHANLARSLEEAREMQWPSKIHQLEPSSKPPQLSPCRVFVRPGESIRHHPEGSTVGSGLRCREVERTVSGAGARSRRHVLHHSKQPRKACHRSPRHDGSTTGKR